jgi:hypothetical protein
MAVKLPKRRSERLSRRKSTLINKAHELAEFCDVDVALIIRNRQTGRYFTYNSVDLESCIESDVTGRQLTNFSFLHIS